MSKDHLREAIHIELSRSDIDDWIMNLLEIREGSRIADIGCGTGRLLLRLIQKASNIAYAIGLDSSTESLRGFKKAMDQKGFANFHPVHSDLQSLNIFRDHMFDVILACFSLYYAIDPKDVVTQVHNKLLPTGQFIVCGPDYQNNRELIEFCESIFPAPQVRTIEIMKEIGVTVRTVFGNLQTEKFTNELHFPSPDKLIQYWRAYYLYDPDYEKAFVQGIREFFKRNNEFITTKRVIGFLAEK